MSGLTWRAVTQGRHVVIIVQNLSVPLDRRVWLECQALRDAGYEVSVICPQGEGDSRHEVLDNVTIDRYPAPKEARGVMGFAWEFAYCWIWTALLTFKVWRRSRFDVIQACNPPDTYWLLAWMWRVRGVRFVYDQHDLNPELFISRFGQPDVLSRKVLHGMLTFLERMTYRTAHHVISSNDFYREAALTRGGRTLDDTTVVRSGPNTEAMRPVVPDAGLRGSRYLLTYIGIMGPQDNVDELIHLMDELVHRRGRTDVRLVLMGFGDCLEELRAESLARGLQDYIEFTGRVGPADMAHYLSAADIGLGPDLLSPLNDVSTMNKTLEYMAYCLPAVSYDLREVRRLAGAAAILVPSGDRMAYADAVEGLLADSDRRVEMGLAARERVTTKWDWRPQSIAYVSVFDRVTAWDSSGHLALHRLPALRPAVTPGGRTRVDVHDRHELAEFIRNRGAVPVGGHSKAV